MPPEDVKLNVDRSASRLESAFSHLCAPPNVISGSLKHYHLHQGQTNEGSVPEEHSLHVN